MRGRSWREFAGEPLHSRIDHFAELPEHLSHVLAVKKRAGIVQDYRNGKRAFCVHGRFWVGRDNARDAADLRVLFQRLPVKNLDLAVGDDATCIGELEPKFFRDDSGGVYHPVLVDVGEVAQDSERVCWGAIPSLVRLEAVKHLEVSGQEELANAGLFEPVRIVLDRELNSAGVCVVGSFFKKSSASCHVTWSSAERRLWRQSPIRTPHATSGKS